MRVLLSSCLLTCCFTVIGSATVIDQNLGGTGIRTAFFGESFTTPTGNSWDDLSFSFLSDVPPTSIAAAGTAFLLSTEYLGTPTGLSTSTPGFIADASAVGGAYVFAPAVVLLPGTVYYLYENASMTVSGSNATGTGQAYFASTTTSDYAPAAATFGGNQTANYVLTADAVTTSSAAPEPASAVLMILSLGALYFAARRQFRTRF